MTNEQSPPLIELNGQLVALARERERLTQAALAERLRCPPAFISRVEAGIVRRAHAEFVERLATVLQVAPTFFSRMEMRHLAFHRLYRLQRKLPARDLAALEADIDAIRIHFGEFLKLVELKPWLALPPMDLMSEFGARDAARYLRRFWQIRPGPIDDLTALLERAGILVFELHSAPEAFTGLAVAAHRTPPMIFVPGEQTDDRRRLTLAHELGHLLLHETPSVDAEEEAFTFAAEFLLPETEARPRMQSFSLESAVAIKAEYRISMQAATVYAERLGMITEKRKTDLFKVMSARGWRRAEPFSLPHEPTRLVAALMREIRVDLEHSEQLLAEKLHETPERVRKYYDPAAYAPPRLSLIT